MSFNQIEQKLKDGFWCYRKSKPNIHYYYDGEKIIGYDVDKDFLSDYNGGEEPNNLDMIATDWDFIIH